MPDAGRAGIVVCRGCCCGSPAKAPATDHDAQLTALRRIAADHPDRVTVRTSECLGPCEQANVVVVRPSPAGRLAGGRPVWFGLLDGYAIGVLRGWVTAGGPGLVAVPDALDLHRISRPRPKAPAAR